MSPRYVLTVYAIPLMGYSGAQGRALQEDLTVLSELDSGSGQWVLVKFHSRKTCVDLNETRTSLVRVF